MSLQDAIASVRAAETTEEALGQVLGYVSMAWSEVPSGVFQSDDVIALSEVLWERLGVAAEIADERATHEGRGWTAEHDDEHRLIHLVYVANEYARTAIATGDRHELVKAGSVIVAAIDYLDRKAEAPQGSAE